MLDNGADPNILDKEGYGPIHNLTRCAGLFTRDEFAENIRLLLAPRVSPTAGDPNLRTRATGFTPLHVALNMRCQKYVFDALLRGGADVCQRDNAGRTSLEYHAFIYRQGETAIHRLLWENTPEFREMRLHAERVLWRPTHGNRDIYQRILEEGGLHPPRRPSR